MTATLETIATEALSYFTTTKRDGEEESIYVLKDDRPEWVNNLIYKAHDDMFPDDFKYEYIHEVLEYIADGNDPDEYQPEPDIYNNDRLKWLASHWERVGYTDEAAEEFGLDSSVGILDRIGYGQVREKETVYCLVLQSLRDEEIEDEEGLGDEDTEDESA